MAATHQGQPLQLNSVVVVCHLVQLVSLSGLLLCFRTQTGQLPELMLFGPCCTVVALLAKHRLGEANPGVLCKPLAAVCQWPGLVASLGFAWLGVSWWFCFAWLAFVCVCVCVFLAGLLCLLLGASKHQWVTCVGGLLLCFIEFCLVECCLVVFFPWLAFVCVSVWALVACLVCLGRHIAVAELCLGQGGCWILTLFSAQRNQHFFLMAPAHQPQPLLFWLCGNCGNVLGCVCLLSSCWASLPGTAFL
jgi:hypothetical protein